MSRSSFRGQEAGEVLDPTTAEVLPCTTVTALTLVRHGEVEGAGRRVVRGQLDAPLSGEGRRQGELLARWCARSEPAPAALLSSDLSRCSELAAELGRGWDLEVETRPELREQDMGSWQGRTWEEVQAQHGRAVHDYWDDYVDARPPGGESLRDVYRRAGATWDELAARWRGQSVVVVTHIGVIRCLLCRFLSLPPSQALRFAPASASLTQVLISDAGAVLNTLGERPWLFAGGPA